MNETKLCIAFLFYFMKHTLNTHTLQGRLADTDARWNTIAGAVDDRTPAERGELGEDAEVRHENYGLRSNVLEPNFDRSREKPSY